jgi:CrcB protein
MPLLLIGLGGFAGAITRYVIDGAVSERTAGAFPFGTLLINVSGSFILGLLFALTTDRAILPAEIRGPVLIGFIGAYTTFSTWMLESHRLAEAGEGSGALVNLAGSLVLGLGAAALGRWLGGGL